MSTVEHPAGVPATEREEVILAGEADESGLIKNRTWEDAVILGPALIVPMEDVTLDSNKFYVEPDSLFVEFPEGRPIRGAIGLRHVTFRRCEFRNVAIAGTRDEIAAIRSQFRLPAATGTAAA